MASEIDIPIIDLSGDEETVARQLVEAAADKGFIYIRNRGHDISVEDSNGAFNMSKMLFDAPLEEKQSYAIQKNNRGWVGMHSEILDPKHQSVGDFKEAFNIAEFVDGKAQQPLPPTLAAYEPQLCAFSTSCRALCLKILKLLGIGLQVGNFFSDAHRPTAVDSGTILRFLKYPHMDPAAHSNTDFHAGAHSDYGSITLLFRLKGQAGLELQNNDGSWAPVPVCPPGSEDDASPPILVNIGDLLSYWTNGLFKSIVHRVVFNKAINTVQGELSTEPRYSIAYFCHPAGDALLEPVPSDRVMNFVLSESESNTNPYAKRQVMTAYEHLLMRLKASYGTLYET